MRRAERYQRAVVILTVALAYAPHTARGGITVQKLDAIHASGTLTSFSFAPQTLASQKLYVILANSAASDGGDAPETVFTSGAVSFVEVGTPDGGVFFNGPQRRVQAFRAMPATTQSAQTITATFPTGTSFGFHAVLLEFDGVQTSGVNGAGAVVQSGSANNASPGCSGNNITIFLAPFASPENRPVMLKSHRAAEAAVFEAGYTQLDLFLTGVSPAGAVECQWSPDSGDNTPSVTWATGTGAGAIALEIAAAVPDAGPATDAGTPDGGTNAPAGLGVGCDCEGGPGAITLIALLALARMRRRPRPRA